MQFLSDLDSVEVLKQVSSKLPLYSGVKWCRHAFDMKKNCGQVVTFHDLVKFVETAADLATDPVFSPDVLKSERNRRFEKDKNPSDGNRRPPSNLNSSLTATNSQTCIYITINLPLFCFLYFVSFLPFFSSTRIV